MAWFGLDRGSIGMLSLFSFLSFIFWRQEGTQRALGNTVLGMYMLLVDQD
jgi:hypothetical protein